MFFLVLRKHLHNPCLGAGLEDDKVNPCSNGGHIELNLGAIEIVDESLLPHFAIHINQHQSTIAIHKIRKTQIHC